MTIKYDNVYIQNTSTIAGPLEKSGPLDKYFDNSYKDFYIKQKTFEQAEMYLQKESISILLEKEKKTISMIDLFIGGDLTNQISISNFTAKDLLLPYIGIYSACATSTMELIIASMLIDKYKLSNILCTTSSHNLTAERQFRYPVEYGGIKPKRSTFTATGAASIILGKNKSHIKVTYGTIGKVNNSNCKDAFNMGEVMAIAACDTLYEHLKDTKRNVEDYDLILTGDLGVYGKNIMKEYMLEKYNINISKNYNDCGVMLYDLTKQEVFAGGSGPSCLPLVSYSKVYQQLKEGTLKRVLLIATGAIFSPTTLFQKLPIPSIAHAISLEVLK